MHGYVAPEYRVSPFTCPHCGVVASQTWFNWGGTDSILAQSVCKNCDQHMVWHQRVAIWPLTGNALMPNPDMPEEIKADYLEAQSIAAISPRGAAALLRLAIDKLTIHLRAEGRTIDDRIQDLVNKGFDPLVQQMLDTVRVIGNEQVHPGQIDVRDDPELLQTLFWLVNEIVNERITKQQRVQQIYATLPKGKRKGIEDRAARAERAKQANDGSA